jgi:hypothetical protein
MAKASFRKGALGSPWSTEVNGPTAMDPGNAENFVGPRIGSGVMGDRVRMEIERDGMKSMKGRGRGRRDVEE